MKKIPIMMLIAFAVKTGATTITIENVVTSYQTESQRQSYLGRAGELVRNTSEPEFPLTQYDGVSIGGVGLVSWKGALVASQHLYTTNAVDWTGWTTTGTPTNDHILLMNGEYLDSPFLTDGIIGYSESFYAPDNGSLAGVVVYTNSTATPVNLPYYGSDAKLRITGSVVPLVGDLADGLAVPNTNGVIITGVSRPDILLSSENPVVRQHEILSAPENAADAARYDTVLTSYTNAMDYTDAEIVEYQGDTTKALRGNKILSSYGWNFISSGDDSNRVMNVSAGGIRMVNHDVGYAFCTINSFKLATNSTHATVLVSTNQCATAPVIEYLDLLDTMQWQYIEVSSNSFPTANGSNFVVQFTVPDANQGYFRAVRKDGNSKTTLYADEINIPNLPTSASTNGLPVGAIWNDSGTLKVIQ